MRRQGGRAVRGIGSFQEARAIGPREKPSRRSQFQGQCLHQASDLGNQANRANGTDGKDLRGAGGGNRTHTRR
jgi:hypothetical protein